MDFFILADHIRNVYESEKLDIFWDIVWVLKKDMVHQDRGNTNRSWRNGNIPEWLGKETEGIRSLKENRDHSSVKIAENTQSWRSEKTCLVLETN